MFRDDANKKHQNRGGKQQGAHIGEPALCKVNIEVPGKPGHEHYEADRSKKLQWTIKGTNFKNNQQKSQPITQRLDVAFSNAIFYIDRHKAHTITGTQKSHSNGCRIGKAVR